MEYYIIAVVIGIFVGVGIPTIQKSALTSVKQQRAAADYVKKDSLKYSVKTETFLYKKIEKKPKNR